MSLAPQRVAYSAANADAVHRNLRFLEHVVTGPIGLITDLKSLREAMSAPGAQDDRDRIAFQDISPSARSSRETGIAAQSVAIQSLALLSKLGADGDAAVSGEWRARALKVLGRVADRLGADLRRETARSIAGVYVIVDPEHTNGRPVTRVAEAAIRGGAAALQYRDKKNDKGTLLGNAKEIAGMCRKAGVVFVVNDDADIARLTEADGLHCGQKDLPVREARWVLAPQQVIGKSNATVKEALDAEAEGADYIAVGAMFATSTKADTRPAGLETLRHVKRSVAAPVVAIGGITLENIAQVVEAGADAVCVASAVSKADDPEASTRQLVEMFERSSTGRKA